MSIPATPARGLEGIVAAHTRLSDVQGDVGQLIYRNHLPNQKELAELKAQLAESRELPKGVIDMLQLLPESTPPMHALRTAVSALGCFDAACDDDSMDAQRRKAIRLIAQIPVCTAYYHRARQGRELISPDPALGEAANFLYMMDGEAPSAEKQSTIDLCYVLHA